MAKVKLIRSYDEVGNIRTFVFETGGASWQPGQYQTWELPQVEGDEKAKKRFFTIAAAPSEGEFHISTRVSDSPFKQALNALQPGDEIEAHDLEAHGVHGFSLRPGTPPVEYGAASQPLPAGFFPVSTTVAPEKIFPFLRKFFQYLTTGR